MRVDLSFPLLGRLECGASFGKMMVLQWVATMQVEILFWRPVWIDDRQYTLIVQ